MDLLNLLRGIAAFILLIQCSASHSIVATCHRNENDSPPELFRYHPANPSPIYNLSAELRESQSSLIIKWAINVDSSIHTLTGTWIRRTLNYDSVQKYRCQYEPPFPSQQINLSGLQQLWFSFTEPNVSVCPSTQYRVLAYNLPTPPPGTGGTYIKTFEAEFQWKADIYDIYSVLHDDKIVVTFNASSPADRHTIELRNQTRVLNTVEKKGRCNIGDCQVELEYTGPCEDLTIRITPHFERCSDTFSSVRHKVNCTIPDRSGLVIGVGCVLALLFVLPCGCITCQILRWVRGSKRGASVRVLLVYPAVDGVFQRAVMLLAQFLQSRGGVTVVIDVWERGSLAEQGPLRWLNSQVELADRVLIVSPPQRTQTDDLKSNVVPGVTDDTVSASAGNLFALTLNLVSSAAHDPCGRDKFWVVNLERDEKSVQTELRGCRTFVLPRDAEKLHQQLWGREIQSPALLTFFRSFYLKNELEHMKINTDLPTRAEANSLDEKHDLLP